MTAASDLDSALMSARQVRQDVAELIRPPRRIRPSEAASEQMRVVDGSGRVVPWSVETTPYMQEPMDCLASRRYDAVIFVGPSRSGKTMALVDGWVAYVVGCDPGDMLVVQITEDKAREYSKKRLDRMLRNSPELAPKLSQRGHDNNVHDKMFRAGNYLGIQWPSINVLSSSDYRFVALTDYDRLPENIDNEGDAFSLASKRTQTFLSSGMTLVESSPGWGVADADWRRPEAEPHAAPPTKGALQIYNLGTRCRWYWKCDDCAAWYQPIMENWHAETARPFCPHCGCQPEPQDKRRLNINGRWVPEGSYLDSEGVMHGEARQSRIASFWMEGPAAAYQPWDSLAQKLQAAEKAYEETGTQENLKTVINTDWGRPYQHRKGQTVRSSERLMDRAEQSAVREVPKGVRYLTCSVDVQGGKYRRFVVQVEGFGVHGERWLVDRFNIREDRGPNGDETPRPIDPAACPEDWDILTRDLGHKSYRLSDGTGRRMLLSIIGVDMGGESAGETSVSSQAYSWWRRAKKAGLSGRVILVKGASSRSAPRLRLTYPSTSGRKDRKGSGSKGDVPLLMLGTNELKDVVSTQLGRETPGPGYVHIPDWLGRWFYDELTYEVRDERGQWAKPGQHPNEAFDLCAYNTALHFHLGGDRIDWDAPPPWAAEWDKNPLVIPEDETAPRMVKRKKKRRTAKSSAVTR